MGKVGKGENGAIPYAQVTQIFVKDGIKDRILGNIFL